MASFFKELKRRNVVKVSVAYAAAAWLVAQIAETVVPVFGLSNSLLRSLFVMLGLGFAITVALAWIYDFTPEGIQRTDDLSDDAISQSVSGRALDFIIIACLSIAVVFLILDRAYFEPLSDTPIASVAVLPLSIQSSGTAEDLSYLGEGIADSLIMRLSRIPRLKVKSRSMIRQADEDIREIGVALGVDAVFMGKLTQREDALEIVVELVDTVDGSVMWSGRFVRRALSLIAMESEVSAEIVKALRVRLSVEEEAELVRAPTKNAAAYRLYLQGRYFWNQRSERGLRLSADYYQRAINLDPDYALAWSGLADSYLMLFGWGIEPANTTVPAARSAADRAIELDATLAEPHATLGYLKTLTDWDWDGAEQAFLHAIDLNNGYSTAHHWYAFFLSTVGDSKGAIEEILKARDSEPLSPIVNSEVSFFYLYDGQYSKAIEELQSASLISPDFSSITSGLIRAYALEGRFDEAIAIYRATRDVRGDGITGRAFGSMALPTLGLQVEAREFYEYVLTVSESSYVMPGVLGILAASIGDKDAAFAHFNKALDERSMVISWLRDPFIDNIKDDPRYAALFERVGLTL